MEIETPITNYGGRVQALFELKKLSKAIGVKSPAFAAAQPSDLLVIDQQGRPSKVSTVYRANDVPPEVVVSWAGCEQAFEPLVANFLKTVPQDSGLPVLKLSYLCDNDPVQRSFAGVGATIVTRGTEKAKLSEACIRLLQLRYRGYAQLYRSIHDAASDISITLVAIERLQERLLEGVAWGGPNGYVMYAAHETSIPHKYKIFIDAIGARAPILPSWLNLTPGVRAIQDVIYSLCVSGIAGEYFEIEFWICQDGTLMFKQWRPIPTCNSSLLDACIVRHREASPLSEILSPFSRITPMDGRIRQSADMPCDISELRELLMTIADEIWVVPYESDGVDIFKLLVAAHIKPSLSLPPLLVSHSGERSLGHLHAILPEDRCINTLIHLPNWAASRLRSGDNYTIKSNIIW